MTVALTFIAAIIIFIAGAFGAAVQTQATMPDLDIQLPRINVPVSEHAMERHGMESYNPADIRDQLSRDPTHEIWCSLENGKILYLVALGSIWGGRIIGAKSYEEITAFARPRKDWNRIIVRDKYLPVSESAKLATTTYSLVWWEEL